MAQALIPLRLPLDADGFLRRECPACFREFKWRPTPPRAEGDLAAEAVLNAEANAEYFCPYCGHRAAAAAWWTRGQLRVIETTARDYAVSTAIASLQESVGDVKGASGGLLRVRLESSSGSRSRRLTEPNDMRRVDFTCHPGEPVKVLESWADAAHCLVCGQNTPGLKP